MRLQKALLLPTERPDQVRSLYPPAAQRLARKLVLAQELTPFIEADPVAVKQLVHVG